MSTRELEKTNTWRLNLNSTYTVLLQIPLKSEQCNPCEKQFCLAFVIITFSKLRVEFLKSFTSNNCIAIAEDNIGQLSRLWCGKKNSPQLNTLTLSVLIQYQFTTHYQRKKWVIIELVILNKMTSESLVVMLFRLKVGIEWVGEISLQKWVGCQFWNIQEAISEFIVSRVFSKLVFWKD